MQQVIRESIARHHDAVDYVLQNNISDIEKFCTLACERLKGGGKLFFAGNGGSAADSQHLAAEFVGRFKNERSPLPAIALTADTSILTAVANDYGYDEVFRRQVSALCNEKDILVVISTSGNSSNLVKAVTAAKAKNTLTVGLLGKDGGELKKMVDLPIVIGIHETARIQECHILIGHILCDACDEKF